MQPSGGMFFIFLLVRLQWNRSNTEGRKLNERNNGNGSIRDNTQYTVQPTSHRLVPPVTAAINPSTVSHAAATTASAKAKVPKSTEPSSWPNTTAPRPTDGTASSPQATLASTGGINNSATNFNRIPMSSARPTTTGDLSGVTTSAAATSASTGTPSNSPVTYGTPAAAALPSDTSSVSPTGVSPTSPAVKQDTPTPNFNPSQQTTELNHNFSNSSTASPNSKDANEDKTNKGGVIGGVIVGAILGSILIGLIGYLICGKKRSELFSHRRLYDDTRNDPVLHLDNSLGPCDTSFAFASDDKTSTADKAADDNAGCPSDGILMSDMTPPHPSP